MSRIRLLFLSLIISVLPVSGCQKPEIGHTEKCTFTEFPEHPKAQIYQAVLDKYTAAGLPGISALVRDQYGVWVGSSGMSDISRNIRMQPCTISKAASLTKTFIAALTLKLAEEGVFALDDPVDRWLPGEVLDKVKNARGSTIRMLLNHTTGIADVIEDNGFYLSVLNNPAKKWRPEELIKFVYGDDAVFPAGTSVKYSNTNFLLMAMIINAATGRDHSELLREKIIAPLGLGDTYYYWHDPLPSTVAQGYFDLYNNGSILNMSNFNTGSGNGYGGIYSTVFDLQTFIEALVREKRILSASSMSEMLTFTAPEKDANRANGLGIFKDFLERAPDQFAYGHRGRDLAYTADMYWFPNQDYTMTYLINYGTDAKSGLRQVFYDFRTAMVDAVMEN